MKEVNSFTCSTVNRRSDELSFMTILPGVFVAASDIRAGIPFTGQLMTAKHKLNGAYLNGSLLTAAAVGLASGSWLVFLAVAILLIGAAMHDGSIRK